MNDTLHCGKTASPFVVPITVKSIAELDLKRAMLSPIAAALEVKWQSASEDVN